MKVEGSYLEGIRQNSIFFLVVKFKKNSLYLVSCPFDLGNLRPIHWQDRVFLLSTSRENGSG